MPAQLAVIGSFVQDLAFTVNDFPAPGQTIIGGFFTGPGGKGSNQAVAAHRQQVQTIFIGCVGEDIFAAGYREWCAQESLPIHLLTAKGVPTGAASIVVNARAENAIVVALGANDSLTPQFVLSTLQKEPSISVVLLQAESNLRAAEAALYYARENALTSIFNPAPINPSINAEVISLADYITPNETECAFLVKHLTNIDFNDDFTTLSDDTIREVASHLPSPALLITTGASGSILYQRESPRVGICGVKKGEIIRTPALSVNSIDTTGAGDAFNGGLAAGLVKFHGNLRQAIRYATVVAGLSTEKMGTAPAMPSADEVKRYEPFYACS